MPSKPVTDTSSGHPLPAPGQLLDRAQREHVGGGDQRGDARIERQHLGRRRRAGRDRVLEPLDHRDPVPGDAGRGERLPQARSAGCAARGSARSSAGRCCTGPSSLARPSRMQMTPIRRCPSASRWSATPPDRRRVVDADQVGARDARLVADHRRAPGGPARPPGAGRRRASSRRRTRRPRRRRRPAHPRNPAGPAPAAGPTLASSHSSVRPSRKATAPGSRNA